MTYQDLENKVVLITGGAAGLGAAAAKAFLAEGCKVAIVDVSAEKLAATAAELGGDNERLIAIVADVSKEEEVKRYVEETMLPLGPLMFSSITQELRAK